MSPMALQSCMEALPVAGGGNVGHQLRFTRPDGTWFQRDILSAQHVNPYDSGAVNGAGGQSSPFFAYFTPLHPNILYPAGSVIQIDQQALSSVEDVFVVGRRCVYNRNRAVLEELRELGFRLRKDNVDRVA